MPDPSLLPTLQVSAEQLKLMWFGPRREIIAALANEPDLSARDLAERLHRPVTGLYRHLDRLLEARLIRSAGERRGPSRPETLFALAFATFSTLEATETAEGRAAMAQAAARYAAATARKFTRAVADGSARLDTRDANAGFRVMDLQLDRAGVEQLHRLMIDFVVKARKLRVRQQAGLETISVTILYAPGP
jgi:DNA-binding transcriptional ArsR family regulator